MRSSQPWKDREPDTTVATAAVPEQASGRLVDFRSDQFSLASVIYEMGTGKRAFQKDTPTETLAAIMRDDPEPIVAVNAGDTRDLIIDNKTGRLVDNSNRSGFVKSLEERLADLGYTDIVVPFRGGDVALRGWLASRQVRTP